MLAMLMVVPAWASDWPMYKKDARRSAVTDEKLTFPLHLVWKYIPSQAPRPAWPNLFAYPQSIDFACIRDAAQPVLLEFDYAPHPIVSGDTIYFGSSADDTVRAMSLTTGKERWRFTTDGPVRFAPSVANGLLYVTSDDGYLYCLKAENGSLKWKFRAAHDERMVMGNGRMISRWPCRTGALVLDGKVYLTAGMWPAGGIFIYALDATSGKVIWCNDTSNAINAPTSNKGAYAITGVVPQGYLLAALDTLIVPTGRSIPASFSCKDGSLISFVNPSYQNKSGGPVECITTDDKVLFGITPERQSNPGTALYELRTIPQINRWSSVRAIRAASDDDLYYIFGGVLRRLPRGRRYRVKETWRSPYADDRAHCMTLTTNAVLIGGNSTTYAYDKESGELTWQRDGFDGHVKSIVVANGHVLITTDKGTIYNMVSDGASGIPAEPAILSGRHKPAKPLINRSIKRHVERVRKEKLTKGVALVTGRRTTRLAEALARETDLTVVVLLHNIQDVEKSRERLIRTTDLYGRKIAALPRSRSGNLPFADYTFNYIAAYTSSKKTLRELYRVLSPCGGIMHITAKDQVSLHKSLTAADIPRSEIHRDADGVIVERGKLAGSFDWDSEGKTDKLVKWPLEMIWFGAPYHQRAGQGSRTPLLANGRAFVTGKNHLIAVNAYNGTELWSLTMPYAYRNLGRRKNAPGPIISWMADNMVADDDWLYLTFGDIVCKLDAATGEQKQTLGTFRNFKSYALTRKPTFTLNNYRDIPPRWPKRGQPPPKRMTPSPKPAGKVTLSNTGNDLLVSLALNIPSISDKAYWELFFDFRPHGRRTRMYERGMFHIIVYPVRGEALPGIGPAHPPSTLTVDKGGKSARLTISWKELKKLAGNDVKDFAFGVALNHLAGKPYKAQSGGRIYMRWEHSIDDHAYVLNNGWARIGLSGMPAERKPSLKPVTSLPEHAQTSRLPPSGKPGGYVRPTNRRRTNPLTYDEHQLVYDRGKGCGRPIASKDLMVLRSATLAFYDLVDDSGMRYFGGIRPGCSISATPALGIVFAAEGSPNCSCNYNLKCSVALAPAARRSNEDWAMFMDPADSSLLVRKACFNFGAPGDRRDSDGHLWLQYPRAPTHMTRSMSVPLTMEGDAAEAYRYNADRTQIDRTDKPWIYASGYKGISKLTCQLFTGDKYQTSVFNTGQPPLIDGVLDDPCWDRRYAIAAGKHNTIYLSSDDKFLYIAYEKTVPTDRKGVTTPWKTKDISLPHKWASKIGQAADDGPVWDESAAEFYLSNNRLTKILHFGASPSGSRYDGLWTSDDKAKGDDPTYTANWSSAISITDETMSAEFAISWHSITNIGITLDGLRMRPIARGPVKGRQYPTYGYRPGSPSKFFPISVKTEEEAAERRYSVVLHFAEMEDIEPGERVFDIKLQDKIVAADFDIAAAAKGTHKALARTFNVIADKAIDIEFIPKNPDKGKPPTISALEISLEQTP